MRRESMAWKAPKQQELIGVRNRRQYENRESTPRTKSNSYLNNSNWTRCRQDPATSGEQQPGVSTDGNLTENCPPRTISCTVVGGTIGHTASDTVPTAWKQKNDSLVDYCSERTPTGSEADTRSNETRAPVEALTALATAITSNTQLALTNDSMNASNDIQMTTGMEQTNQTDLTPPQNTDAVRTQVGSVDSLMHGERHVPRNLNCKLNNATPIGKTTKDIQSLCDLTDLD